MNTNVIEQEQQLADRVEASRGLFYHEQISETRSTECFVNVMGIDVPTHASAADIELIAAETARFPLDQQIMRTIAECYVLRQPLLIEGQPGLGKTYHLEQFARLVHGADSRVLLMPATPRTTELEIMGRWAPVGSSQVDQETWYQTLAEEMQQGELRWFLTDMRSQLDLLRVRQELDQIDAETASERAAAILVDYQDRSQAIMMAALQRHGCTTKKSDWQFIPGYLTEAFTGNDGRGMICVVDEFNVLASNYQQVFLTALGGRCGQLNDRIPTNDGTGQREYRRGPDTWVAFAINSPETTEGRNVVADAVTDRVRWLAITPEQNEEKREQMTLTAGGRLPTRTRQLSALDATKAWVPATRPIRLMAELQSEDVERATAVERLHEQICDVYQLFTTQFLKLYRERGDRVQGQRRIQQLAYSRTLERVGSYLEHFQLRDEATGNIDMAQTLRFVLSRYYIDTLCDSELRQTATEVLEQILDGTLGSVELADGSVMARSSYLNQLAGEVSWSVTEKAEIAAEQANQTEAYRLALQTSVGEWFSKMTQVVLTAQLRHRLGQLSSELGLTIDLPITEDATDAPETGHLHLRPGDVFRATFEERLLPRGGIEYRVCSRRHKIIKLDLDEDSSLPQNNREYQIMITRDTEPDHPDRGILFARIEATTEDEALDMIADFSGLRGETDEPGGVEYWQSVAAACDKLTLVLGQESTNLWPTPPAFMAAKEIGGESDYRPKPRRRRRNRQHSNRERW